MSDCPTPESLAIWADEGHAPGVAASHIAECPNCSAFVQELKADQALLQRHYEVPVAAYGEVRSRVLSQVVRRKPARYYLPVAGAVAAAILLAMFLPRPQSQPTLQPTIQPQPVAAQAPPMAVVKTQVKRTRTRKPRAPVGSSADLIAALDSLYEEEQPSGMGSPGQSVITIATDDPDVTIILLGESTGDEE